MKMNVEEQEEKSTKEGGKVISKERKKRQEEKVSTCDAKGVDKPYKSRAQRRNVNEPSEVVAPPDTTARLHVNCGDSISR